MTITSRHRYLMSRREILQATQHRTLTTRAPKYRARLCAETALHRVFLALQPKRYRSTLISLRDIPQSLHFC